MFSLTHFSYYLTDFYATKTLKSPSTETKTSIPLNLQIGVYYHVGRIVGYNIKHISSCQEASRHQQKERKFTPFRREVTCSAFLRISVFTLSPCIESLINLISMVSRAKRFEILPRIPFLLLKSYWGLIRPKKGM